MTSRSIDCPAPHAGETIQLAHGGGGRRMRRLIDEVFLRAFAGGSREPPHDSALVTLAAERIAFTTDATNLFAGDMNGTSDIAVWDARGAPSGLPPTIERVTGAIQSDASSSHPSVSDDGGFVAFVSFASNLVPGGGG